MPKTTNFRDELDTFDAQYGSLLPTALDVYADTMRDYAASAETEAWCPERPPVPERTDPDGTTYISLQPTPAAYAHMAAMFNQAADQAGKARDAYGHLTDLLPS